MEHIKTLLKDAAFLVSQNKEKAHSKILEALISIELYEEEFKNMNEDNIINNEVKKVTRRLKLWAKRPNQINTKILIAYLKLKRAGQKNITENSINKELNLNSNFESNFAQMKIISEKNHGKIFELYGDKVSIWKPVLNAVNAFEHEIFLDE